MIYAKQKDAPAYRGIHPSLDLALERITPEFLASVGSERVDIVDGVYATRFTYETVPAEESFFEAHKKYLDIHIMVEGREGVEIAPPEALAEFDRVEANDFYAYRGEGDYKLILSPGDFLVVFPGDAHRIKMQLDGPKTVSKVVFKVKIYD
ncbi:YhcH/YjgK/YiaL family protein [uncultured Oscillibacter sp.]|jgi:biofilm protein TabA|uniref:YhcH/YjgK/YiaL family protein n=1 Tax=uncultured Oscillibacter sp. TaxID=876091 RepID=UPI0025F9B4B2|nr:YhcH/YjgK/YiaL family protein [uncultured Oscillibacter sp.]